MREFPIPPLDIPKAISLNRHNGAVAEWSKAHAWKVCRRETVSRVRIPVAPPPFLIVFNYNNSL